MYDNDIQELIRYFAKAFKIILVSAFLGFLSGFIFYLVRGY